MSLIQILKALPSNLEPKVLTIWVSMITVCICSGTKLINDASLSEHYVSKGKARARDHMSETLDSFCHDNPHFFLTTPATI